MTDASDPERQALVPAASTDLEEYHSPEAADFDFDDFEWVPVHRRPRKDGWTIERQRRFIETLAATGSVTQAALEAGMSTVSAYRLRNAPDGRPFAAAWDIAVRASARRLVDLAMDRAINGSEEPVFDRNGQRVGRRVRYNDRLLMFLLRALQPERFRNADRAGLAPGEALPPPTPPVADALAMLTPPAPAAPHALMAPDDLAAALQVAQILKGELPLRHRGRDEALAAPFGPEFEDMLDPAKQVASPHRRDD